jgi:two-component system chemotaxis sensor kinase CheA
MATTKRRSLRSKFVRTMLLVTALMGISTIAIVVTTSKRASQDHLRSVQRYIEEGIESKGRVLTENHALALRGLTLDNAFGDMQKLVRNAVEDDQDVVYGLYVNADGKVVAYSRRGQGQPRDDEAPPQNRVQELQIADANLLVQHPVISHVTRLGRDVVEVAVPVVGEDDEALGTIRYGLSTSRMQQALLAARSDADARMRRSVVFVGSLAGLAMLIGLLLSRIQAVRITRPVGELTQAARTLAGGDRSVRVDIESRDELEDLGSSFNHMVEDLDSSYRRLEDMNRTLEQRVLERTTDLAQKNRDMRLVLDNVDQGLVTVHPDGTLAVERSRVVEDWFGSHDKEMPLWTFVERTSRDFAIHLELGWLQLMDGILPLEVSIAQLPTQLTAGARTWSFRYLPFGGSEKLEGVLVVINDVTERLALEREQAEQSELVQAFHKLMLDRAGFLRFIDEGDSLVQLACAEDAPRVARKRALHTLKGNAALVNLTVISGLAHQAEEGDDNTAFDREALHALSDRWRALLRQLNDLGATRSNAMLEVRQEDHARVIERLMQETNVSPALLYELQSWAYEPLSLSLERLAAEARALAVRLGKGAIRVDVETTPKQARLDPKPWAPFFSELVHLVRNAVDHGLEYPGERDVTKKPLVGTLKLSVSVQERNIVFEVSDDGRGVDWARVRDKARALKLAHSTQEDLESALFEEGLTTRDELTATSGRGVGLTALKGRVERMHGRIEVSSETGGGTRWRISFPRPRPRDSRRAA